MLHKNAVIFAVVSHIYCKTYSFDVFAAVLWGSHRKSGAVSAGFIENAAVLGERSSARCVDLGSRRDLVFAKCIAVALGIAGFCVMFCRDQVGFVLYYRCLPVNPSAHGVVLRFDWGLFGADVDKTAFFLSFAGVCGCLLPIFCAFALAGFDIKSVKRRRE